MNKPSKKQSGKGRVRSSISVGNEQVCEDEACIGQKVDAVEKAPAPPDEKQKKEAGTRISIGGQPACSDDGCIGKK